MADSSSILTSILFEMKRLQNLINNLPTGDSEPNLSGYTQNNTDLYLNLPLTGSWIYNNGTAGVGATLTRTTSAAMGVLQGLTTSVGTILTLGAQADPRNNGIYEITQDGDGVSVPVILTRLSTYDESSEIDPSFVVASQGQFAGITYVQKTVSPVIGTDNIIFSTDTKLYVYEQSGVNMYTSGSLIGLPYHTTVPRQIHPGTSAYTYNSSTKEIANLVGMGIGLQAPSLLSPFVAGNVLNIGNGAAFLYNRAQLRFGSDAASNKYVSFKAPAALATTYAMTLPPTQGTANTYLKNDGSGNLSWASTTGLVGGSPSYISKWSSSTALTSSIIYEDTGKIGIGTILPDEELHVAGNIKGNSVILPSSSGAGITITNTTDSKGATITCDSSATHIDTDYDTLALKSGKLKVDKNGNIIVSDVHNNSTAIGDYLNGEIRSGTYDPAMGGGSGDIPGLITYGAITSVANADTAFWIRVGNVITISGYADLTVTNAGTQTISQLNFNTPNIAYTPANTIGGTITGYCIYSGNNYRLTGSLLPYDGSTILKVAVVTDGIAVQTFSCSYTFSYLVTA